MESVSIIEINTKKKKCFEALPFKKWTKTHMTEYINLDQKYLKLFDAIMADWDGRSWWISGRNNMNPQGGMPLRELREQIYKRMKYLGMMMDQVTEDDKKFLREAPGVLACISKMENDCVNNYKMPIANPMNHLRNQATEINLLLSSIGTFMKNHAENTLKRNREYEAHVYNETNKQQKKNNDYNILRQCPPGVYKEDLMDEEKDSMNDTFIISGPIKTAGKQHASQFISAISN